MFLIMFKTGHALPLAGATLLRPRSNRGEHAEYPRKVSDVRPQTRQIRDPDSVERRTQTQIVHVRELSLPAFNPRKQARPQTVRVFGNAAASTVREPAAVTSLNCPQTVRSREASTSANSQSARTVREHEPTRSHLRRRVVAAILPPTHFPVRIQINPAYVLV